MISLVAVVLSLLALSFLCSILESVILSITRPYIQHLIDKNNRSGMLLKKYKEDIEEPITAILTLNTISHTIGATVSGAIALQVFGSGKMALFSAVLTLLILLFSEIIPKTVGARYWKSLGPVSAVIIRFMIIILKPVIIPVIYVSRLFSSENPSAEISKIEVLNYLKLGYMQGTIKPSEFEIIENILKLHSVDVRDIMTPRTIVFWLPPDMTTKSVQSNTDIEFSRIPLYNSKNNTIDGIVFQKDIMEHIADRKKSVKLKKLSIEPLYIVETASVFRLIDMLITNKQHMAIVINEPGDYTGVATLEDALETLIGREIVDEFDKIDDMKKMLK